MFFIGTVFLPRLLMNQFYAIVYIFYHYFIKLKSNCQSWLKVFAHALVALNNPSFINFLLAYLFSIQFLYYFIFIVFVPIQTCISKQYQSNNLHLLALYTLITRLAHTSCCYYNTVWIYGRGWWLFRATSACGFPLGKVLMNHFLGDYNLQTTQFSSTYYGTYISEFTVFCANTLWHVSGMQMIVYPLSPKSSGRKCFVNLRYVIKRNFDRRHRRLS